MENDEIVKPMVDEPSDGTDIVSDMEELRKAAGLDDMEVGVDQNGKKILSIDQGAELLRKLSEFNTRKEDILKKLSAISERMETRISEAEEDGDDDDILEPFNLSQTVAVREVPAVSRCQMITSRTRETKAPAGAGNGMVIYMPEKSSVDDGYRASEHSEGGLELNASGIVHGEKSVTVHGNLKAQVPTGVRVSVPEGWVLCVKCLVPGMQVLGKDVISPADTDELSFTVWNYTESSVELEYGKPLFAAFAFSAPSIECDELLKSTFSSWISGGIRK